MPLFKGHEGHYSKVTYDSSLIPSLSIPKSLSKIDLLWVSFSKFVAYKLETFDEKYNFFQKG